MDQAEWPVPGTAQAVKPHTSSVEVFRVPGEAASRLRFAPSTLGYDQITFLLLGVTDDGWLKVAVPVRPNGTVGWVRAADADIVPIAYRITIELSSHRLTLWSGTTPSLRADVATGTGGTPTPTGLFFVRGKVPQANPNGGLGPVALGLSGYSEVLNSFANGDGAIGLHGTNAPGKLGHDVSHGCIRVANDVITRLAALAGPGTPVEIVDHLAPPAAAVVAPPVVAPPDQDLPPSRPSPDMPAPS